MNPKGTTEFSRVVAEPIRTGDPPPSPTLIRGMGELAIGEEEIVIIPGRGRIAENPHLLQLAIWWDTVSQRETDRLNPYEQRVLLYLAQGFIPKEIAKKIKKTSDATIKISYDTHGKLGVTNAIGAVLTAASLGEIDLAYAFPDFDPDYFLPLTDRHHDVLKALVADNGRRSSNKAIGEALHVKPYVAGHRLEEVFQIFGTRTRAQTAAYYWYAQWLGVV